MKTIARITLPLICLLTLLTLLLPFIRRTDSGGADRRYSGYELMRGADAVLVDGKNQRGKLIGGDGEPKRDEAHLFVMIATAAICAGLCALDRKGATAHPVGMICGVVAVCVALSLSGTLAGEWRLPDSLLRGAEPRIVADRMEWGGYATAALGILLFAHSLYGFAQTRKKRAAPIPAGVITRVGVLGAMSAVLYMLEVPIIGFYKLDFSNLPVLLAGFSLGAWPGIAVLFIKDFTGLLHSSSMGVGELADFVSAASLLIPAVIVYKRRRTYSGAMIGLSVGVAASVFVSALANYYIMIPFFVNVMHWSLEGQIIPMIAQTIPAVDSLWKLILLATIPFNLAKGVALSLVLMPIYMPLRPLLK